MKAETREALKAYQDKFGQAFPLDGVPKHSEENALVLKIKEAMKSEPKKRKRSASMMVKVQED